MKKKVFLRQLILFTYYSSYNILWTLTHLLRKLQDMNRQNVNNQLFDIKANFFIQR